MITVESYSDLWGHLKKLDRPLGFVPTMGFLHQGHLSLVRKAREQNASVAVSIFTNPTQFGPGEDLENYPRDLNRDLELLQAESVDVVWIPTADQVYPPGFQTWVTVENLTQPLEGQYRPTHFKGVATVVAKLFNAVQPERSYFGQKDAQQAAVIRQMAKDLDYPMEIIVCPIVREADGLAMSSRNSYLDPSQRQAACCLSRGLFAAQDAYREGERKAERLKEIVRVEVAHEPLAEIQYISCADPLNLLELQGKVEDCLLSLAVYLGKTRLIDNVLLSSSAD